MNKINSLITKLLDWSNHSQKFLKIFQILYYYVPAVVAPIYGLVAIIASFQFGASVSSVGMILFAILASYACFKIYWSRAKDLLNSLENSKFFIVPAICHVIRTSGEIVFAISMASPVLLIFVQIDVLASGYGGILDSLDLDFLAGLPILGVILAPLYGYFIMIGTKLVSELLSAVVTIANNTAK